MIALTILTLLGAAITATAQTTQENKKIIQQKIFPTVRSLYAEGGVVIALIDGKATANDGKPYNMSYTWFMTMKEGRIIQVDAFLDGIQFADIMKRLPAGH